ncbi:hypothetical protein [Flindersiella endophytica]
MTRFRSLVVLAAVPVLLFAAAGTGTAVTQPDPGVEHVHAPAGRIFYTNTSTGDFPYAGFAALFDASRTNADGTRSNRVLLSYKTARDAVGTGGTQVKQTADEGKTWQDFSSPDGTTGMVNVIRLADAAGTVVAIDYEPTAVTAPPGAANQFRRWLLTPTGWSNGGLATFSFSEPISWARVEQAPILLGDGKTVLVTLYGAYASGTTFVIVARSVDGGTTWTEASKVVTGGGFNEASIVETTNGQLVVGLRRQAASSIDLYVSRSPNATGDGPWSAPSIVSSASGAAPLLQKLGNGVVVMGSGRNDNVLRFSMDGTGATWLHKQVLYQNYPTQSRTRGSSGYLGIAPLSANRFLVVGDNCAPGWGCPAGDTGHQVGKQNALWSSLVEADTAQWGKLDLRTKFQRGEIAVMSALTSYGQGRTSLAAYAFDGDARADSSVVSASRSVVVRLDRPYELTGLGLHAHLLGASDVRIETSLDGSAWTTPTRATRAGIVRPFATPVTARYLRLTDPNASSTADASFLHELEVYTTTDGFENDYPGEAPRGNGLQSAQGVVVVNASDVPVADSLSSRFLRVRDTSSTAISRVSWRHAASTSAVYEFKSRAVGQANKGLLFSVLGTTSSGAAATPYHLLLNASGQLFRYNWATATWIGPLNPTPLTANSWNTLRLEATTTSGTLYANGATVATFGPSEPAASLTGNQLASSGTVPTGDDWLVDDLAYTVP